MLTVPQAAEAANVHPETIRRWLRDGTLHGVKIGHTKRGTYRIPESEVRRMLGGERREED